MSTELPSPENKICLYPFSHLAVDVTGKYRLCCISRGTRHSVNEMSAKEWFHSDYMKYVRSRMLDGQEILECSTCYSEEKIGKISKRLKNRSELNGRDLKSLNAPEIVSVDWRAGNSCNAQCTHCQPQSSSSWGQWSDELLASGIPILKTRQRSLKNGSLDKVIEKNEAENIASAYFAGGEPLTMPGTKDSLACLNSDCVVQINTNLSILRDDFLTELKRFKYATLICSIDGVDQGFEFMRYPLSFKVFQENIDRILAETNCDIFLTFALSYFNVPELSSVLQFAQALTKKTGRVSFDFNIVHWPNYLKVTCASKELRKKWIAPQMNFLKSLQDHTFRAVPNGNELSESILNAAIWISEAEQEPVSIRANSEKYLVWLLKRRPEHINYLERIGILSDFGISGMFEQFKEIGPRFL